MKEIQDYIDIEGLFLLYRINRLLEKKLAQQVAQPQHVTAPQHPQTPLNQPVTHPQTQPAQPATQPQHVTAPQHLQTTPSQNFGKELTNLAKLYTKNTKYSGEDDNFDYKLMVFYDLCKKASLP